MGMGLQDFLDLFIICWTQDSPIGWELFWFVSSKVQMKQTDLENLELKFEASWIKYQNTIVTKLFFKVNNLTHELLQLAFKIHTNTCIHRMD